MPALLRFALTVSTLVAPLVSAFAAKLIVTTSADSSTLPVVSSASAERNQYLMANSSMVQSAQKVAYVVESEGRWLLNNNPVRAGETLYEGGVIINSSPSESDRISISDLAGKPIESRRCKVVKECSRPITLPRTRKRSYFEAATETFQEVMATLFGKPGSFAVPGGVREVNSLANGVGQLEDGRIDLSAIFKQKEADRYYIRLVQSVGTANAKNSEPIVFDWNPAKPASLPVPGAADGLYELTLLVPAGDEYKPTNDTSWVLITTAANYGQVNRAFREMVLLTESWGRRVTPEAKDSFLRASLSYLMSRQSK